MKQRKTRKKMAVWALALLGVVPMVQAQELVRTIEAEDATLSGDKLAIKSVEGVSGGKYVGNWDNTAQSLTFTVTMEKEGTYEFRTYYMCGDASRGISIKVNSYKAVTCKVPATTAWDNPPTGVMSANIYMDAGENTIVITPYPETGPNLDKFEIYTTKEVVLPEVDEFPKVYEAEDAELYGDLKTKPTDGSTINGLSGGRYVGDFNQRANSYLVLPKVEMPEAGTYELKVFSMGSSRALSIKVNQYEPTIIRTQDTPDWDGAPALETSVLVYLDKGNNKIVFNSYNDDGPNIDKFEFHETDEEIERPEVKLLAYAADYTDGVEVIGEGENVQYVVDNDEYTIYTVEGKTQTQVTVKCEYPVLLTGYLLSAGIGSDADVTAWTLESSMDGSTWAKVPTPSKTTDLSGAYLFEVSRSRDNAMNDRAQYYRLTATGETNVEIAEWQLFGSPYLDNEDGKNFPVDITEGLDIQSAVSAFPIGNSGEGWSEEAYNLFDRNLRNKYYVPDQKNYTVEIALDKAYKLDAYTLTSVDVDPERNPKKWTFNGYNDEFGWVELDRQTEFTFPCGYATMRFDVDSELGFTKFLLDVEDNNGDASSQLLKWQLFGTEYTGSAVETVDELGCSVWSKESRLCIHATGMEALTYQVFDLSGALQAKGELASTQEEVALSQGMYVVTVSNGDTQSNMKVIVK